MRGLKLDRVAKALNRKIVASFTDAWIETDSMYRLTIPAFVASFTDAWIETGKRNAAGGGGGVASFTDAWIETEG